MAREYARRSMIAAQAPCGEACSTQDAGRQPSQPEGSVARASHLAIRELRLDGSTLI